MYVLNHLHMVDSALGAVFTQWTRHSNSFISYPLMQFTTYIDCYYYYIK